MKKYLFCILLSTFGWLTQAANAGTYQPFVDVLAWKAAETNSSWVTNLGGAGNTTYVSQSNVDFNTRAGIRAGLTYTPTDSYLNTKIYWTYFPSSYSKTIPVGAHALSSLFFSGSFFLTGNFFLGASANWDLAMNMLDAEVSHTFNPAPNLTFVPRIGLKGGSINQNISILWRSLFFNATENLSNHYTGIGPSFGIDGKWNVYQGFSVVGDLSTALMYGRWNDSDVYHRPAAFLATETTISTSQNQSKLGTLMLDYYVGLQWEHHGRSNITAKLGYEMQYWPEQLRLLAVQQLPTLGDLTIQGAVCGISIDL